MATFDKEKAASELFEHASKQGLPASAHKLLSTLFELSIAKGHPETGEISNSRLSELSGLPRATLTFAIRKLEAAGLLKSERIARAGSNRTLHLPEHGRLYDIAHSPRKPLRRIPPRAKRRINI